MQDHGDSCLQHALSSSANRADLHEHGDATPRASRRGLLRAAGLLGAGAMATAALPAAPAAAHARGKWNPDTHSPRFTLVVMPDTQYLFDEDRGDLLPLGKWWHVAMVNDGNHTIMYVDGCPVLRNPSTSAIGVATAGKPWLVGAYHYADVVEQAYYGWLGDVRIVGRALRPDQFLNA